MMRKRATRIRAGVLGLAAMAGGTLFSGCTVGDLRHNVISGLMGFVEDYTVDLLGLLVPSPDDLIGADENA